MAKDEWVRAAMTDDMVVVELLVRLKQAQADSPTMCAAVFPLKWGMRQPRSRLAMRCDGVERRKEGDSSTRCSPTTPLSWSGRGGEASPSGTADGLEETSRQNSRSPSGSRSKITSTSEATSITLKRSRKKKTFSELKEEENLLLKERIHLKKELAILRATFMKQRATNDNLKRMKLDLGFQPVMNSSSISNEEDNGNCCQNKNSEAPSMPRIPIGENHSLSYSSEVHKDVSILEPSFSLPDLNMMPLEEDSTFETLYGMRG
ncbi:hypothetical protein HS088_TW09G01411 [Tripterygium wilfordii]|uniref:Uncharacterized protein n=1 Tax=Tripterygium wilfordii TaxID=458696 RepID=A0A7J7DAG7_TRIWF|nr:uncharacterized protein LOC120004858 [Tripterygium wilfordii]KAF5743343.1 hypothetical protein HS088_TW09G01411 [Tripterygium wilfordii]